MRLRKFFRHLVEAVRAGVREGFTFSAAAVAFYMMTGLIPLLVACLLICGLVADSGNVISLIDRLAGVLPPESLSLVQSVVVDLVSRKPSGLALAGWIVFSLWSGSKAMNGLMLGLRTAYGTKDDMGVIGRKLAAVGLSLLGIVGVALLAALLVILPLAVKWLSLEGLWNALSGYLRWPVLVVVTFAGLSIIYRAGIKVRGVDWRSVLPGAMLAAILSTAASAVFSWYAGGIGDFGKSYGSLAAVILLLLWCYLNAIIVLLGAHFNVVVARQSPP